MHKSIRSVALAMLLVAAAPAAWAQTVLLMAEEAGCMWCARWNAEIAPAYAKTGEGQAAPLRRIDKTKDIPADITLVRPIFFTPTFVLLVNGHEKSRLEGYPGEDFFWGLLGEMLTEQDIAFDLQAPAADLSDDAGG